MCPPSAFADSNNSGFQPPPNIEDLIPPTQISKAAYNLASSLLVPAILSHSTRVYLYAKALASTSNSTYFSHAHQHDLLFTACILHDIGTVPKYDGPQRFEVEGADAAVTLLREQGVSGEDAHQVWMAIALHTSPGIAERINELTRLVRQAVVIDFGRKTEEMDVEKLKREFEGKLPRIGIEKVLGDAVVQQAVGQPSKAPAASWVNNMYTAYLAGPDSDWLAKGFGL